QGALPADRDDRVEAQLHDVAPGALHAVPQVLGADPGGAEDGAAAGEDAADRVEVQLEVVALQEALPAVPETDDLVAVVDDGTVHDRPDDGVQPGAVAAGREDTNAHRPQQPSRVGADRTALSGSRPATLAPPGGRSVARVRLLDDPAHLCGPAVRRAGPRRSGQGCEQAAGVPTRAAARRRCARCAGPRTSGRRSGAAR